MTIEHRWICGHASVIVFAEDLTTREMDGVLRRAAYQKCPRCAEPTEMHSFHALSPLGLAS